MSFEIQHPRSINPNSEKIPKIKHLFNANKVFSDHILLDLKRLGYK